MLLILFNRRKLIENLNFFANREKYVFYVGDKKMTASHFTHHMLQSQRQTLTTTNQITSWLRDDCIIYEMKRNTRL